MTKWIANPKDHLTAILSHQTITGFPPFFIVATIDISQHAAGERKMNEDPEGSMETNKGSAASSAEQRLEELAIKLPEPPTPFGPYA